MVKTKINLLNIENIEETTLLTKIVHLGIIVYTESKLEKLDIKEEWMFLIFVGSGFCIFLSNHLPVICDIHSNAAASSKVTLHEHVTRKSVFGAAQTSVEQIFTCKSIILIIWIIRQDTSMFVSQTKSIKALFGQHNSTESTWMCRPTWVCGCFPTGFQVTSLIYHHIRQDMRIISCNMTKRPSKPYASNWIYGKKPIMFLFWQVL